MMQIPKTPILTTIWLALSLTSPAQHMPVSLKDSMARAVRHITAGTYIFNDSYRREATSEQPKHVFRQYRYTFTKTEADTLLGYHMLSKSVDGSGAEVLYDGKQVLTNVPWTQTLEVMEAATYPRKVKSMQSEYLYYPYFQLHQNTWPQKPVNILGTERFHEVLCYKVQVGEPVNKPGKKVNSCYFVAVGSYLPMGERVIIENKIADATEKTTFEYWISDIDLQQPVPGNRFTRSALTPYLRETAYLPENASKEKLLANGAVAPGWELPLISGGTLALAQLTNKIVVLDFWYKACVPCQHQMIALEQLHQRFRNEDVVFIGVNTIDDPEKEQLVDFLKKRKISMQTVYRGAAILQPYGIRSAPVLYIIGKDGKVLHTRGGYGDDLPAETEKIIRAHL